MMPIKKNKIPESLVSAIKLHQAGSLDEAEALYLSIIETVPKHAEAQALLGFIQFQRGNHAEAARLISASVAINPAQPDAYHMLGNALEALQRYGEALASYDKVIASQPERADAFFNRGQVLRALNRHEEAIASYDKVIALKPDYADAHYARAISLMALSRCDEAIAGYEATLALKPDMPYLAGDWLHARMYIANWQGLDASLDWLAQRIAAGEPVCSPFIAATLPLAPSLQKICAEVTVRDKFSAAAPLWDGKPYAHDKIRIGYFSADYHDHATAYLIAGLIERHDRARFEITGFSFGPQSQHPIRARLEKAFDRFIDVSAKSDAEISALARKMEIDIAVDLKGFTGGARPGIFAARFAPVQVSYLGFPGTMGAPYIDYLIADAIVIPEGQKQYYAEKIVYLPGSYQVNDALRRISEKLLTRAAMGLPEKGFVFCSFNSTYKITADAFAIWMRLLQQVEGSVLWLLEGHPAAMQNLRAEAAAGGIDPERLIFAPYMEQENHLARHRLADLFLDTFYCNAHTTASDALWAGLPLLTCIGDTFASRVAASVLTAAGLPEMITTSREAYEALALELATHPEKLSPIRRRLYQNRESCPLFDTALFAKRIEAAYTAMWEKAQTGQRPADISIPA